MIDMFELQTPFHIAIRGIPVFFWSLTNFDTEVTSYRLAIFAAYTVDNMAYERIDAMYIYKHNKNLSAYASISIHKCI